MPDFEKCCLTHFPAPVLAQVAKPIEEITDDIRTLAGKMIDIMLETKVVPIRVPHNERKHFGRTYGDITSCSQGWKSQGN